MLDYLWGTPTQNAIIALLTARADRSRALNWIQIGAIAGATIELASVVLRSANLRLQGSGQGSVSTEGYLAELPVLVDEIAAGTITVRANALPLAEVEEAWGRPDAPASALCSCPNRSAPAPRPQTRPRAERMFVSDKRLYRDVRIG